MLSAQWMELGPYRICECDQRRIGAGLLLVRDGTFNGDIALQADVDSAELDLGQVCRPSRRDVQWK